MRTQPNPSGRQDAHWPTGAATRFVGVAALLLVGANHAQAQAGDFVHLHFNTATSGNYGAGASIDSSDVTIGDFGSSVVLDNVAIGATQPPQGEINTGPFGSFTELAANVTRTRTSSAYTVVPELGAAVDSSELIADGNEVFPTGTTNGMNAGAIYTDQFWFSNPEGSILAKALGFTWTPDPATTLTFPTTGKNNRNEMSLTFTPQSECSAHRCQYQVRPGLSPAAIQR